MSDTECRCEESHCSIFMMVTNFLAVRSLEHNTEETMSKYYDLLNRVEKCKRSGNAGGKQCEPFLNGASLSESIPAPSLKNNSFFKKRLVLLSCVLVFFLFFGLFNGVGSLFGVFLGTVDKLALLEATAVEGAKSKPSGWSAAVGNQQSEAIASPSQGKIIPNVSHSLAYNGEQLAGIHREAYPAKADAVSETNTRYEDSVRLAAAIANSRSSTTAEEEIRGFLVEWAEAWQQSAGVLGDFDTYMSCYSDLFFSGDFDKREWINEKALKNRKKDWITVQLSAVDVVSATGSDSAVVRFSQKYSSSNYTDVSNKQLVLQKQKEESGWKIVVEKTL